MLKGGLCCRQVMQGYWSKCHSEWSFHAFSRWIFILDLTWNVMFKFFDICFTWRLIVVDIYPLQLQVTVTLVAASGIDAMLITNHLPELRWERKTTLLRLIFVTVASLFSFNFVIVFIVLLLRIAKQEKWRAAEVTHWCCRSCWLSAKPDGTAPAIHFNIIYLFIFYHLHFKMCYHFLLKFALNTLYKTTNMLKAEPDLIEIK